MPQLPSIFTVLHKWASRQDENFATEALVAVLRHLLKHEPHVGRPVLSKFCLGDPYSPILTDGSEIVLETQHIQGEGRPDIRIEADTFLAYVEVKKASGLGSHQLKRYRIALNREARGRPSKLVLLTQYPVSSEETDERPDFHWRWQDLADTLLSLSCEQEVTRHLCSELVTFLRDQNMVLERVNWQYIEGFEAYRHLMQMLAKALEAAQIPVGATRVGLHWSGYYLEDKKFWIGIPHARHHIILFEVQEEVPFDSAKFSSLAKTENNEGRSVGLDLTSEAVCFFSKGKSGQLDTLTEFAKTVYTKARDCLVSQSVKS